MGSVISASQGSSDTCESLTPEIQSHPEGPWGGKRMRISHGLIFSLFAMNPSISMTHMR